MSRFSLAKSNFEEFFIIVMGSLVLFFLIVIFIIILWQNGIINCVLPTSDLKTHAPFEQKMTNYYENEDVHPEIENKQVMSMLGSYKKISIVMNLTLTNEETSDRITTNVLNMVRFVNSSSAIERVNDVEIFGICDDSKKVISKIYPAKVD